MQFTEPGKRRGVSPAGVACVLTLVVAVLAYAYVGFVQLRLRADMPLQIDELFFATCAARGLAAGEIPISGCHDNKAPFIYVIYQALQALAGNYALPAFKIAALAFGFLNAFLAGFTVRRLGGGKRLVLLASALLLLLYVHEPWFLALKPESVGTAFVLLALLLISGTVVRPRLLNWFMSGVLFGVALATKQTYIFPLFGLCVWVLVARRNWGSWAMTLARLLLLGLGASAPLAVFALLFWIEGRFTDFAASLVLYPMLYKSTVVVGFIKGLLSRLGTLAGLWMPLMPLMLGYFVVVPEALLARRGKGLADATTMYVFVSFGMLLILLASPIILSFHIFPATAFAVIALLISLGRGRLSQPPGAAVSMACFGVLLWAVALALNLWAGPAGNPLRDRKDLVTAQLHTQPGDYAYIVGIWPKLYADNGLVPASDILYPTAFPGAPQLWSYKEPPPNSDKAKMLADLHRYNEARLLADFAATPPKAIVVVDGEGRTVGASDSTDIRVLRSYIEQHCQHAAEIDIPNHIQAQEYTCAR